MTEQTQTPEAVEELALAKTHRPNYVSEGVWDADPERSTWRTRVKCDGDDCGFYAEDPSWFRALDKHSAHVAAVIAAHVAERVRAAVDEAWEEVERAVAGAVPPINSELLYDGREDPHAAAYVEGFRDAWQAIQSCRATHARLGAKVQGGERTTCGAGLDGDCFADGCPQIRDDEPRRSGRFCPLRPTGLTALREGGE